MAEAATVVLADPAKPRSRLARLIVPLAMLLVGAGAGAAGALLVPPLLADAKVEKPAQPKVSPLQYVEIKNNFTVNLKDTGRFAQVTIAVSTQGGQPIVDAIERHHVAIVAAVLDVLADTPEEMLVDAKGRQRLADAMRGAINDVLRRKAGVAGVDDVFLTSFVMQ